MAVEEIGKKFSDLTESELNAFYESLTQDEMSVLIRILVQFLVTGKIDDRVPGIRELKASILSKYGSFRAFVKHVGPVTPGDSEKINSILDKLRGPHGA